ncbi:MAG: glycosyltransferase family 2 protein [Methanomicrobiales archaeon]|nr:glycosyltransferase family 2 protein [Methanomicrobiales archaeon]MDD1645476.1 glycosyltransferase family 2 protein [Methanomicrobiales archaeon]MDD1647107.1 glycosyltransferase family 2 protein [Methanomicrobiales archaeon]
MAADTPRADESLDVSVILPALNEEKTITTCIGKILRVFHEQGLEGEVIVADSSSDATPDLAARAGARVIRPEQAGYGNAYLAAFRQVRGRIIVIGDADDTYDFADIPRFLVPVRAGADLVIGSRFTGEILPGSMAPLHRYVGNPLLTWLINAIYHTHFTDTHSGFRAITRDALRRLDLKTGGMEFASEMLIRASEKGLSIAEIPIRYYPRQSPSKIHSFADGWRHLRFVLLMRPLPFLALPGLLFAVFGLTLMTLFYLSGNLETSRFNSFILGTLLLLGGIQAILAGVEISVYSIVHGFMEKRGVVARIMNYHSLEEFLVAGGLLILTGFVLGLRIITRWVMQGFGALTQFSNAIISMVLIVIGLEVLFFAIFVSMMLLNENTRVE